MEIPWQKIISHGGRAFIGGGACVPFALIDDLLSHADDFKDVELCHVHTVGDTPWIEPEYEGAFRTNSFFMSRSIRTAVETGQADYTPTPSSDIPRLFERGILPLDVAIIQVSEPDHAGMVSLGLSADTVYSAVKYARCVVAQINPKMPRTHGDTVLSLKKLNYTIRKSAAPAVQDAWVYDEKHMRAAEYTALLIEDGSTIQASMGNSPQAVLTKLYKHKHLGIHTGCFTNEMMKLMKKGVVDNSLKTYQKGVSVASHCLGSRELYKFINENLEIELYRSELTNDPTRIGRQKNMVAINGAREVDLTGQVVRDSRGHHFYGGMGATQDIFYEDGTVFYFSSHQEGIFPHTGLANEKGALKGKGATLNVPLKAGAGDVEILAAWGEPLYAELKKFHPDLIIVSTGFDAAAEDPLADLMMTSGGFRELTKVVRGYADEFSEGRLISVLEGGYDVESLAACVKAHLRAME